MMAPADIESLGLSQEQVARAVGVASDRTVRKWEGGEREIPGPVAVLCDLVRSIPTVAAALVERAKAK